MCSTWFPPIFLISIFIYKLTNKIIGLEFNTTGFKIIVIE